MADLTWGEIKAAYARNDATIAAVTDGSRYLADAELELDRAKWGDHFQRGRALLALHYAYSAEKAGRGPAGALVSESLADMSRSYAAPATPHVMEATTYGRDYLEAKRRLGRRIGGFLKI